MAVAYTATEAQRDLQRHIDNEILRGIVPDVTRLARKKTEVRISFESSYPSGTSEMRMTVRVANRGEYAVSQRINNDAPIPLADLIARNILLLANQDIDIP